MEIKSKIIQDIIKYLTRNGYEVIEISEGWERVRQVIHMSRALSESDREYVRSNGNLRYWMDDASPHNVATEGFTDDISGVAVCFPARYSND